MRKEYGEALRYLVTGGAGFLGSHLSEKLISLGHEVLAIDNFYTGEKRNIQHLINHPKFEILRHDVTLPLYVEVDGIFNLACPASPVQYQKFPVQTTKTSVLGSINMLGLAKRLGVRVLQASTSEVYGDPQISPQNEEYWGFVNPIGQRSCYDEGKRVAETLFFDYRRQYNLDARVVRIFNTYGPRIRKDDGRVVSNFVVQALQDQNLTIYGDGSQTRCFCYVDDLILGLIQAMNVETLDVPVNIGNDLEFTMIDLANLIIKMTNSNSKIITLELPSDDPRQRRPDLGKAKRLLSWEASTTLESGLKKTIDYFKNELVKEN